MSLIVEKNWNDKKAFLISLKFFNFNFFTLTPFLWSCIFENIWLICDFPVVQQNFFVRHFKTAFNRSPWTFCYCLQFFLYICHPPLLGVNELDSYRIISNLINHWNLGSQSTSQHLSLPWKFKILWFLAYKIQYSSLRSDQTICTTAILNSQNLIMLVAFCFETSHTFHFQPRSGSIYRDREIFSPVTDEVKFSDFARQALHKSSRQQTLGAYRSFLIFDKKKQFWFRLLLDFEVSPEIELQTYKILELVVQKKLTD